MAKLTKQFLSSFLATKKPLGDLLKTTRSSIDDVKDAVDKYFQGEYKTKWFAKIEEYESECEKSDVVLDSVNDFLTPEEEYLKLEATLNLKISRLKEIQEELNALSSKMEILKDENTKIHEDVSDLKDKLEILEKEIVLNLVFSGNDDEFYENIIEKYKIKSPKIEELVEAVDDASVAELLAKIYLILPLTINMKDAIILVKSIIFIKEKLGEGRIIRVYAPQEIIKVLEQTTNLDENSFITK